MKTIWVFYGCFSAFAADFSFGNRTVLTSEIAYH